MKPKLLLPPVVALALTGIWLGSRHRSISVLEKESALLREHMAIARASDHPVNDRSLAGTRANGKKEKDKDAVDWKSLADTMAQGQRGGTPDMRAMMKLQAKLMGMSGPELTAALDEIAALELGNEARRALEGMLIGMLAQKEPQLVLERYFDKIDDPHHSMGWQLAHAFQQWAGKDGAAATAWFDAKIVAGKFESKSLDGKSQGRLQFEAAIVGSLMATDPDAAGKRIAALPEDQRRELFQQGMLMNLKPGSEKAYAALIREHVPEAQRGGAFATATSMMIHQGGYEKVGKFLDEIDATPAERKAVASQAASNKLQQLSHQGKIDRAAIDEMRAWVGVESPESVDAVTGESLGNLWSGRVKWEDSAALVGELHAEGASDELLVSFLNGPQATQHRDAAIEMAGRIEDETKRAEVLERFGGQPAETREAVKTR